MDRYGGGKDFTGTLRGSRVHFRSVYHIDALPGVDYYRYETLRVLGDNAIRWDIRVQPVELHSQLDLKETIPE